MRVYKYKIEPLACFDIPLPKGAKILRVGKQGEEYFLWALVDPEAAEQLRHFLWIGTGHEITEPQENLLHVCTFFDEPFVWHIFEVLGDAGQPLQA